MADQAVSLLTSGRAGASERESGLSIAVFDYRVRPGNPVGSCHRALLGALAKEHRFTVFAAEFDNPAPDRITHVPMRVPLRPLALLFTAFHLWAAYRLAVAKPVECRPFDLIQSVESNIAFGDVVYAHFCHRAYMRLQGRALLRGGLRGWLRWLDHALHTLAEPAVYRRARRVVVPSHGVRRELETEYPVVRDKIDVIPNPVDTVSMQPPADLDREKLRRSFGLNPGDLVIVFVALGHFERKGLPVLLDALVRSPGRIARLLVVGGQQSALEPYRVQVRAKGLADRVIFIGSLDDVRPALWASDALALPSLYEVFPLVVLEAAAAGLPIIVSRLHGVEEFLRDGLNGLLVERNPDSLARTIGILDAMGADARAAMGRQAAADVQRYGIGAFADHWRNFYGRYATEIPSRSRRRAGWAAKDTG
jgi:glycosyltransferase involved in cell wall biosynthesis